MSERDMIQIALSLFLLGLAAFLWLYWRWRGVAGDALYWTTGGGRQK